MKIYPDDWQVRYTSGLIAAACIVATMLLGPAVGIHGFWPFMLSIVVAVVVGNVLGLFVSRMLFRPPTAGQPENEKDSSLPQPRSSP